MFYQMGDEDEITCACATAVHACFQRRNDFRSTDYLYVYSHNNNTNLFWYKWEGAGASSSNTLLCLFKKW